MPLAKRLLKIFGGVLLTLFLSMALLILWINNADCSRYTGTLGGWLGRYTSWDAQKFEGCGIHIGLTPRVSVSQLALVQTDANSPVEAVQVGEAAVQMRLWPLLSQGRIIIEAASLRDAELAFRVTKPTEEISPRDIEGLLDIVAKTFVKSAELSRVKIVYRGEDPEKPLSGEIESLRLSAARESDPVAIKGQGRLLAWPFELSGEAGSLATFAEQDSAYPIKAQLEFADQKLSLDGRIDPRSGQQAFAIGAEAPGLANFSEFLGRDLSRVPAYKVKFNFKHLNEEQSLAFEKIEATLGRSFVYGDVKLLLDRSRPYLDAQLGASLLRSEDLFSFLPEPSEAAKAKAKEAAAAEAAAEKGPVFTREKLPTEMLKLVDADIKFAMADYTGDPVGQLVDGAKLEASLKDGRLELKPMLVKIAGGSIEGSLLVNGEQPSLRVATELKLKSVDLEKLFGPFVTQVPFFDLKPSDFITGRIAGQIDLKTAGESPRDLASQLDGQIRLGVEEGQLMATVVEAFGFDLTEAVSSWFADNPKTDLECAIVAFEAQNGRLENRAFLIGTGDTDILGKGFIDLGDESMNFELEARPKDFSIGAAKSPIEIKGPFRDIKIGLANQSLVARGAAAVALGALIGPAAAVLPFIEPGLGKEGRCAQYMGRIAKIEKDSQKKL